jgi:hypothetical protein
VSLATLACWAAAWRCKLRADGVLPATSRRQAKRQARALRQQTKRQARALRQQTHGVAAGGMPDPARVLDDLRTLLGALTADPAAGPAQAGDTAAAGDTVAAVLSGTSGAWPDIPGPRSAPEAGRVPRDCQPVPAGPDGGEPAAAAAPATQGATAAVAPAIPAAAPVTPEADSAGTGKRDGPAALESMLAGAELLMVGCGEEEEAW